MKQTQTKRLKEKLGLKEYLLEAIAVEDISQRFAFSAQGVHHCFVRLFPKLFIAKLTKCARNHGTLFIVLENIPTLSFHSCHLDFDHLIGKQVRIEQFQNKFEILSLRETTEEDTRLFQSQQRDEALIQTLQKQGDNDLVSDALTFYHQSRHIVLPFISFLKTTEWFLQLNLAQSVDFLWTTLSFNDFELLLSICFPNCSGRVKELYRVLFMRFHGDFSQCPVLVQPILFLQTRLAHSLNLNKLLHVENIVFRKTILFGGNSS